MIRRPPRSTRTDTLFPYTTLFRSSDSSQSDRIEARRRPRPPARQGGCLSLIEYKGFGGVPLAADMLGDENDPAVLLVPAVGQDRTAWRDVAEALVLSGRRVVILDLRDDGELAPHPDNLRRPD